MFFYLERISEKKGTQSVDFSGDKLKIFMLSCDENIFDILMIMKKS